MRKWDIKEPLIKNLKVSNMNLVWLFRYICVFLYLQLKLDGLKFILSHIGETICRKQVMDIMDAAILVPLSQGFSLLLGVRFCPIRYSYTFC